MLESPVILTVSMIIVVLLAFGICSLGVQKGVEKITKVMMICLFALIVVLAIHSMTLPGAGKGMRFPSKIRWYMTYVIPIIVVAIYLKGYYDLFKPQGLKYMIPWFIIAITFLWVIFSF